MATSFSSLEKRYEEAAPSNTMYTLTRQPVKSWPAESVGAIWRGECDAVAGEKGAGKRIGGVAI